MHTARYLTVAALATIAACSDTDRPTEPRQPDEQVTLNVQAARDTAVGPNDYIVVLKDTEGNVGAAATRFGAMAGVQVKTTWDQALKGFLAELTPAALERLRADAAVDFVEKDAMAYMDQGGSVQVIQPVAGIWGLDRIDQRPLPLNGQYQYFRTGGPPGVVIHVYVIDSGINLGHVDFAGSIGAGISFVPGAPSVMDCNGHGTHVSSTLGGNTFGVAKGVIIHPVRVFDCAGGAPFSRIISAVNWVQANDIAPAVTNMSLGGGFHAATNGAVNALVASGNSVVVAAGNNNANACGSSPASAVNAITVGSTGDPAGAAVPPAIPDRRSSFSNWGPCLDLFAPGRNIRAAWIGGAAVTALLSGTSMASPHAAGAAALLRDKFPAWTPIMVRNSLVGNATLGIVTNPGAGSPNRLLYMGYIL
ncbi:MAG: S8 family peptidase [Gemmatimonadaceae bacterium]|nr:S8 family peptidase [Gemmatimonadaceae bacterium]